MGGVGRKPHGRAAVRGKGVKDRFSSFIDIGQMQVQQGPADAQHALFIPADNGELPAPQFIAFQPQAGIELAADLVAHEDIVVGGVAVERGGHLVFHLVAALHIEGGPGVELICVQPQKMGALIGEAPLGMADRAVCLVLVGSMGRMAQRGHREGLAAQAAGQHQGGVFRRKVVQRDLVPWLPAVAGCAGDGRPAVPHQLRPAVAVDAGESGLTVHVSGQLVIFHPIWPRGVAFPGVGGAVIPVIVVFKAAGVIRADKVAVVAVQALAVRRGFNEGMGDRLAAGELQVAGRAAGGVPGFRIVISAGVEVAAQAAASEQVIHQVQRAAYFLVLGDLHQ